MLFSKGNIYVLSQCLTYPEMGANGSNWYIEQPGWCHEMYSHLSYLPTEMLKKNSESKLLQLLVGEGVRGLIGNRY